MSSADLDHIRALLVAQTVEHEPQAKGLFGRLFAGRPDPSSSAAPLPTQRFVAVLDLAQPEAPRTQVPDQEPELLLEQSLQAVSDPSPPLQIETASPLPPPAPRAGFGRRPDLAPEPELVLDQPATHARRLQLLGPDGQPVGEMILQPDKSPFGAPAAEVPFFPEDFLDHQPDRATNAEPEPLRPWLKALRASSAAPKAASRPSTPVEPAAGAALAKQVRHRRAQKQAPPPRAPARPLGHDLLEALALTLAREHENLADRLLSVAQEAVFVRSFSEPVAA